MTDEIYRGMSTWKKIKVHYYNTIAFLMVQVETP